MQLLGQFVEGRMAWSSHRGKTINFDTKLRQSIRNIDRTTSCFDSINHNLTQTAMTRCLGNKSVESENIRHRFPFFQALPFLHNGDDFINESVKAGHNAMFGRGG